MRARPGGVGAARLLLPALALIALAAPASTASQEARWALRFETLAADGTPWAEQLSALKAEVEAASQGRLLLRLYLNATKHSEVELVEHCRLGQEVQGVEVSGTAVAEHLDVDLLRLLELPYLFRDDAEVDLALDGVMWGPVRDALAERDLALSYFSEAGWRVLSTRASVDRGLTGLRIRTMAPPLYQDPLRAMGAEAEGLHASKVYPMLRTGHLDGYDATLFFGLASGWSELAGRITLTHHSYQPALVVFSSRALEVLPPDLQALVLGDPKQRGAAIRPQVRAMETQLSDQLTAMGKAVVVPDPDWSARMEAATGGVRERFVQEHPQLAPTWEALRSALDAQRAARDAAATP